MNGGRRKGRTFPIRRSNDDCRSAVRQDVYDGALFPTKKSKGSFCRGFAANHMNMKTSTRKRIGRVGILAVLALLLLVCFASCAPKNAQKVTLSYDGDTFLSVAENQDQHALKVTQFKELADLLVATFNPDSFDNREMLVAAWRGYDMLAEDFDDTKINETDEERAERDRGDRADVAAAVKVIAKANELAEEKVSVDYTVLNKADLDVLINAFRTNTFPEDKNKTRSCHGHFSVLAPYFFTEVGCGRFRCENWRNLVPWCPQVVMGAFTFCHFL